MHIRHSEVGELALLNPFADDVCPDLAAITVQPVLHLGLSEGIARACEGANVVDWRELHSVPVTRVIRLNYKAGGF